MTQDEAFDILKLGKNVFLTGAAGSGKTHLIKRYHEYLRSYQVAAVLTATTGIAATHLSGRTIHSWSGIGILKGLSKEDLNKLLSNKRLLRRYKQCKVLIIDEISMLHGYQLEMIDSIFRAILDTSSPFGGIQIILCGDFFQLPPVSAEPKVTQFAFDSTAWHAADFQVCYLTEQHRQKEDPLLQILNDIRSGKAGEHTKIPLRTRYRQEPEGNLKATKLYAKNYRVDAINQRELSMIPGEEKTFTMEEMGIEPLIRVLKSGCLAVENLRLKIGAEVMFIKNSNSDSYVNGTRGQVIGFDQSLGWPRVRTANNQTITAAPEPWQIEEEGEIGATIIQVPLRLAWAITIHKCQGMTLDAAEIDLGDVFEEGMGYVALSRIRRLAGLKLMNLNRMALQVNPQVQKADRDFMAASERSIQRLTAIPPSRLLEDQKTTLKRRFFAKFQKEMT